MIISESFYSHFLKKLLFFLINLSFFFLKSCMNGLIIFMLNNIWSLLFKGKEKKSTKENFWDTQLLLINPK